MKNSDLAIIQQSLSQMFSSKYSVFQEGDTLVIGGYPSISIEIIGENKYRINTDSEYYSLHKDIQFQSEAEVYSFLIPLILQTLDGNPRI